MIDKFCEDGVVEIEHSIIPKLKSFNEITLKQGDTLIIYWDFDKYPMEIAKDFFKVIEKVFPENQILFIPKGSQMEVVKNE